MTQLKRSLAAAALLATAMAALLGYFALTAGAETAVSATPRTDTMQVLDGEVLDSVVFGDRVIVVGTFTEVRNPDGESQSQPYIAAYDSVTGQFDDTFRPDFDNYINSIAIGPGDTVFVGGQFGAVNGEAHRRIAKLSSGGGVFSEFQTTVDATVNVVEVANGKVYLGGRFNVVNGEQRTSLAAVDINTGAVDTETDFEFSFSNQAGGGVAVLWLDISADGSFMFVSHGARYIDDEVRSGLARFDISPTSTTLSEWQTLLYDNELDQLGGVIRARRVAIAPSGEYVVMVTSGGDRPPAADTAVRFPTAGAQDVQADWVSRHFDTVLGVAINDDTVFVGGHFQFQEAPGSDDPFPGDPLTNFGFGQNQGPLTLGSQVVQREQLGALDPATGKSLAWNPGSDSFLGVQSLTWDDELGLLVGHDGDRLGGVTDIGRHGIFPPGSIPTVPPVYEGPRPQPGDEQFSCNAVLNGSTAVVSFTGDIGNSIQVVRNDVWAGESIGEETTIVTAYLNDRIDARIQGANYDKPFEEYACTTSEGPSEGTRSTTVITPDVGLVVDAGEVTIAGQSAAPNGVDFVRLTIRRDETGQYLTADGDWVDEWTPVDVAIESEEAAVSWALGVNLEATGQYDMTARGFDVNGVRDDIVSRNFTVGAAASAPPEIQIRQTVTSSNQVIIAGSASDDVGVESVNFLLQNTATQQYFRLDGTVGGAQRFPATLANPGGTSTEWSAILVDVPAGQWQIVADAFDDTSQRDRASQVFTQSGGVTPPEITLTSGVGEKLPANSSLSFTGEATASAGISRVQVLVRNLVDHSGVGASGRLTRNASFFAIPGTAGGTSRNWAYNTPNLDAGNYFVQFRVTDTSGATDTITTQVVVGPAGDEVPTTRVDVATQYAQGGDSLSHLITGTATDDFGVGEVAISVFDDDRGLWLQPDGSYALTAEPFLADLTSAGSATTDWSFNFEAPDDGYYRFVIRAIDSSGQAASRAGFAFLYAFPDDALPTVEVAQPDNGVTLVGDRIQVTGTADDDIAVSDVRVRIRNMETGEFLHANGSLGRVQWLSTSLTNAGGDRTSWDFSTPELPQGTWQVWARAFDSSGQFSAPGVVRTVTLN